jgi:hypothetical protein
MRVKANAATQASALSALFLSFRPCPPSALAIFHLLGEVHGGMVPEGASQIGPRESPHRQGWKCTPAAYQRTKTFIVSRVSSVDDFKSEPKARSKGAGRVLRRG